MKIVGYYTQNSCMLGNPLESDPSITKHVVEDENGGIQIISPPLNSSEIELYYLDLPQNNDLSISQPVKNKRGQVGQRENNGKDNFGEIIYIRQLHDRPEFTKEQRKIVGKYQLKIWQELEQRQIKDIFLESLYEDWKPHDSDPGTEIWRDAFKATFPDGIPKRPSDFQLETLAEYGAARIYAYLNPDVTLHKTYTKEESASIDREIAQGKNIHKNMMQRREELAAREIMTFLEQNPGKRVVLIYGAAHEFKDDFEKLETPPTLIYVHFPEIIEEFNIIIPEIIEKFNSISHLLSSDAREIPVNKEELQQIPPDEIGTISDFIYRAKQNPQLQYQAIVKAKRIRAWAFQHISSEKGQLLALDKIDYSKNHVHIPNLKLFLIKHAVSDQVKQKIKSIL